MTLGCEHSFAELFCRQWSDEYVLCKASVIHHPRITRTCSREHASSSFLLLSATLSFLSFCNIRDRLAENSDNSRESKPITKVAKLDFQVVAFGHLFSIARLILRNAAIGYLADLFNTCKKLPRCVPPFSILRLRSFVHAFPPLILYSISFQFLSFVIFFYLHRSLFRISYTQEFHSSEKKR